MVQFKMSFYQKINNSCQKNRVCFWCNPLIVLQRWQQYCQSTFNLAIDLICLNEWH